MSLARQIGQAIKAGDAENACQLLERYVRDKPHRAPEHLALATVLEGLGRDPQAIDALARCVALDPALPEAQFQLGRLRQRSTQPAGAELPLRQAVALRPRWKQAWIELGIVLHRLGQWTEARAALERALQSEPERAEIGDSRARYFLGATLAELGETAAAEAHLAQVNRRDPNVLLTWQARGRIRARLSDRRPDEPLEEAWLLDALALHEAKRTEQSIDLLWRAAAIAPGRGAILFYLAWSLPGSASIPKLCRYIGTWSRSCPTRSRAISDSASPHSRPDKPSSPTPR